MLLSCSPATCTVSDALKLFHEALPRAERSDKVLTLAENTTMFGEANWISKLLVRECYGRLWELIKAAVQDKALQAFVVTGTPGIGKSYFGYFLLYELRKQGKTVVYQAGGKGWFRFSDKGVAWADAKSGFSTFSAAKYLSDQSAWLLCDPPEREDAWDGFSGVTVALMSPNRKRFQGLVKREKMVKFVMPPWSLKELQECRVCSFPTLSDDDVKVAFDVVGGVARRVFDPTKRESAESDMLAATQAAKESWLRSVASNVGAYSVEVSLDDVTTTEGGVDRLVCMVPSDNFRRCHLEFASPLVEVMVQRRALLDGVHDVKAQLLASNLPATTRGLAFEVWVHHKIQEGNLAVSNAVLRQEVKTEWGGVSVGQDLMATIKSLFSNGPRERVHFRTKALPSNIVPDVYYVPELVHFPVIDSFIVLGNCLLLLQMKSAVSGVKGLDEKAVKTVGQYFATVKGRCASVQMCVYVFVVPSSLSSNDSVFAAVTRRALLKRSNPGSLAGDGSAEHGFDVWVFGVPI